MGWWVQVLNLFGQHDTKQYPTVAPAPKNSKHKLMLRLTSETNSPANSIRDEAVSFCLLSFLQDQKCRTNGK